MSDSIRDFANLPLEKRKLVLELLQKRKGLQTTPVRQAPEKITAVKRDRPLQLSFAQQRIWFLYQLEPNNTAYHLPFAVRITGKLDADALLQSLAEMSKRHEILRTTFPIIADQPMQTVHPPEPLSLPIIELHTVSPDEQTTEIEQIKQLITRQPFNLEEGPLWRVQLLHLKENEYLFLLVMHHIISDGWSLTIFIRELSSLYESILHKRQPTLSPLPVQYADYAHWQQEWLQGDVLANQRAYWLEQLADIPPLLELPTDHPRPHVQAYHGARQTFSLPRVLTQTLYSIASQENATLFMLITAAYQTLLHHYTHQDDILIGTPIAGRNHTEIEGILGCFLNTIVLRTRFTSDLTFRNLLKQVRKVALDAFAHQDFPFEKLVEELQPERNLSYTPIFQVLFVLQNTPPPTIELSSLTFTIEPTASDTTTADLTLVIQENNGELNGTLEYNADLFEASTIQHTIEHFRVLLEAIAANPDTPIARLPLLTGDEREQLLITWNETSRNYPQQLFHQLFEAQVTRTPQATAVVCDDQKLTYSELNAAANQLAHHLVSYGVKNDTLVPLLADRDINFLIAILAVLKAGGAYLPLDPRHPPQRLRQVLSQSRAVHVLVAANLTALLATAVASMECPPQQLPLEVLIQQTASTENLPPRSTPNSLAYVIFTSGSTGLPKGAMVAQQGMVNHLYAKIFDLALTSADKIAQNASQCFDISVWQFLAALLVGGEVHIFRDEIVLDPAQLWQCVIKSNITILELVPSVMRLLLDTVSTSEKMLPSLRWLIPTGEALPPHMARTWIAQYPLIPLLNAYGPTECSDDVTHYPIHTAPDPHTVNMPIGRPVINMRLYILNTYLEPVPRGVTGELYVGGIGVGRGYLYDPSRTAQAFRPDPFATKPGSWLYKTGDLARFLPDGNIEFLGRVDHQVKIRGYRIELGEIEAALTAHPLVSESVVVTHTDEAGRAQIAAYLVPDTSETSTVSRDHKSEQSTQKIANWQTIYDEAYSQSSILPDATFNTISWDSSYTGQPFPEEEMRDYVNGIVQRILAMRPRRVLEIGCGTGLLLFRIAPHCTQYTGTDISHVALAYVQKQAAQLTQLPPLTLLQQEASDFAHIEAGSFDAVILNSVIQLFPDAEYLRRVLVGAIQAVAPGGFIFVGDVRNLRLLRTFHTSVQLHWSKDGTSALQLQQRSQRAFSHDKELVIDPDFFFALQQQVPQISQVQIQLKRGHYHNEFTRFRYDVVLRIGGDVDPIDQDSLWQDWQALGFTLDRLRQLLREQNTSLLALNNIPNARNLSDVTADSLLATVPATTLVAEIHEHAVAVAASGVDPESLWALCDDLPYTVALTWQDGGENGRFQAIFRHRMEPDAAFSLPQKQGFLPQPWHKYTNIPLQTNATETIIEQVRATLKEQLPDYMVPAAFMVLEKLPLTPNGKIDRKALPVIQQGRVDFVETNYIPPRNPLELQLVQIWETILDIQPIGIQDNFFELGGHSLMAARLMSQIQQGLTLKLPLSALFERPTIEELALFIREKGDIPVASPIIPIQPYGDRRPFFCVHPPGGNVFCYYQLAQQLGTNQPFYGIEAIGLDGHEQPPREMEVLAARYMDAILSVQPEGPYLLGGWCTGGVIAYAVAQQLWAHGHTVSALVLFDSSAIIEALPADFTTTQDSIDDEVGFFMATAAGAAIPVSLEGIEDLSPKEQLENLLAQAKASNAIAADVGLDYMRAYLRVFKANLIAESNYILTPYPGRVILFRPEDRPTDHPLHLGWQNLSPHSLDISIVPGNHNSMIGASENAGVIAQHLQQLFTSLV